MDVRFVAEAGGTTVFLEHRGFERLGPEGEDMARRYRGGWPRVLAVFAEHAAPRS